MTEHPFDDQEPESPLNQVRAALDRLASQALAASNARRSACEQLQAAIDAQNWQGAHRAVRMLVRGDALGLVLWLGAQEHIERLRAADVERCPSQDQLDAQAAIQEAERLLSQSPDDRNSKEELS